jgi:hypothetical protein
MDSLKHLPNFGRNQCTSNYAQQDSVGITPTNEEKLMGEGK